VSAEGAAGILAALPQHVAVTLYLTVAE